MQKRRRFKQTTSLEERLADEARRLREEAQGTPPGIKRDRLIAGLDRLRPLLV